MVMSHLSEVLTLVGIETAGLCAVHPSVDQVSQILLIEIGIYSLLFNTTVIMVILIAVIESLAMICLRQALPLVRGFTKEYEWDLASMKRQCRVGNLPASIRDKVSA